MVAYRDRLYVIGGRGPSSRVLMYAPLTFGEKRPESPPMTYKRSASGHGGVVHG